ncbi:MAG: DUF1611 domain-containing protein [Methanomassiliicoccales archaeon]|nr:MAG: DUF1611 domain-containing protein [Methanomassiliicoccales archaeon]
MVLCEGNFGKYVGKTANGLVRHSERFEILGIIDSSKAGMMAQEVVEGAKKGIPVFESLNTALSQLEVRLDYLIIGVATIGGKLPSEFRPVIIEAIKNKINVIAGLHEFLSLDHELSALARDYKVELVDVRKEPPLEEMRRFANLCGKLDAIRIPVLGTDSSIGKRTSAIDLTKALNAEGVKTVFVSTGQTGILQGFKYAVAIDSIQGDYIVGELEREIVKAHEEEKPEVIIIEGQGSISHPAYVCGTRAIITASQPSGIVLQHAPGRKFRNFRKNELELPMPDLIKEIEMLQMFADAKVMAITINHENMTESEIDRTIDEYEERFGVPCCDTLIQGCQKLVDKVKATFLG